MKYFLFFWLLIFSAAHSNSSNAPNNFQIYQQAKEEIALGADIRQFDTLKTHPLYPYLIADYYNNNLDKESEIIPLFKKFFSAPPIKRLHNRWIKNQFEAGNYQKIVDNYYHTDNQTTDCIYRQSQLLLGNTKAALHNIQKLWFSPYSVSDYCTPVFEIWTGASNAKNLLKRAKLAYFEGNGYFAARMASKVDNEDAKIITLFANFLENPVKLLDYSPADLTKTKLHRTLLPIALEKLIRKEDSTVYASFVMQFSPQLKNDENYQKMLTKLVGYLSNHQDLQAKSAYALLSSPNKEANEALLRFLVGNYDWQSIKNLVSPNDSNSMALYWLGRAKEKLGEDARNIYEKAAKTRSYYGFLAADKIGKAYEFNEQPIIPNDATQYNFYRNAGLMRGKLLYQMGDIANARQEILPLFKKMNKNEQLQLAYWLNRQGFHHDAIYVLGKLRYWNDIRIRFPMPFNPQVKSASAHELTKTDPTWIYAIIRQESSMNPMAMSRAKAKGLMQLIPSTAANVAKDLGIELSDGDIFNPNINIKLGARYLAQMYQRFGNIALASAAYNAGPGRVEQWISSDIDDITIWIEKIPFNETRKYVKHITEYQQVYAKHLGIKIPTITEIITQEPIVTSEAENDAVN